MSQALAFDATEADFEQRVVARSRELPVLVDFWAEWCGPCRQLGPALEAAVAARGGTVELAKVDVDANGTLARAFEIQGIPAVKAFRDGQVVAEFTGALPPAQIETFIDGLLPSQADELARAGDEASLRAALESDPRHTPAALGLARLLIGRGDATEAGELLARFEGDFLADGLLARIALAAAGDDCEEALAAWDAGDEGLALELLGGAIGAEEDPERRDLLRRVMVAIFTELGVEHPLAREHRRRLATALN